MSKAFLVSGLLGLLIGLISLAGCATSTTTSSYYYYPDWTPEGRIICVKEVRTYQEVGIPPGTQTSSKYYITIMSEEGTQEADIKEINGVGKVAASPLGNYIAYKDGDFINIISSAGASGNSIDCSAEADSFSWSPDESSLVFSTSGTSWESFTIKRSGQEKKRVFLGISPAWSHDGIKIAFDFYYRVDGAPFLGGLHMYIVSSEAINTIMSSEGGSPDFSPDDGAIVYDNGESFNINTINLITSVATEITNEKVYFPRWSPSGDKLLYSKGIEAGVWLSNNDGANFKQLK